MQGRNGNYGDRLLPRWPGRFTEAVSSSSTLDGNREAVEELVRALQGDVYALALRMLWNREDAEDATQRPIEAEPPN